MGMNIFHRVLITAGIIFCGIYSYKLFKAYSINNGTNNLTTAIFLLITTLALLIYLYYLIKKSNRTI